MVGGPCPNSVRMGPMSVLTASLHFIRLSATMCMGVSQRRGERRVGHIGFHHARSFPQEGICGQRCLEGSEVTEHLCIWGSQSLSSVSSAVTGPKHGTGVNQTIGPIFLSPVDLYVTQ